ncbi:MAG: peptidoglycan bridge formation glycyltransferase FemA/FemB family protein [Candidatus Cloacimonetes bacterium]|nr:peptidoglycan bridge formation glycyltransferase FemA/FemB family protein [Candidatus Cloacimonadota bacterium]
MNSKIECRILETEEEFSTWNEFVASTQECPIIQSYEWGKFKRISGWIPIRIAVFDDDKIVGGISIQKRNIPYIGKCLFYAPRGPVIDVTSYYFTVLMNTISEIAKNHNAILLKIDPEIDENDEKSLRVLNEHNFTFAMKQIQPRATFFLDLTQSLDDIMAGCESKTRYNIRLSMKKGVKVRENTSLEGARIFYDIYETTAKRDAFIIHNEEYYKQVIELMAHKGMVKLFLAYYDDIPVAGVYIFAFGEKIWYMYGASSNEYRNVMPNQALHWHVIQWAKEQGYKTYDLWGVPAHPKEGHPLFGVYRFKKGFGGEFKKFIGMHDHVYKPFWYNVMNRGINTYVSIRSLIKKGKISDSLEE